MNLVQLLIELALFFCESFMCIVFCNIFIKNNKYFRFKTISIIFLSAILLVLNNNILEMYSPVNMIFSLLIMFTQQSIISKEKIYINALFIMVYRSMIISVTYTIVTLGHYFLGFDGNVLSNKNHSFIQRDLPLIITEFTVCIIVLIIKHNAFDDSFISKGTKAIILVNSLLLSIIGLIFPMLGLGSFYCFNYEYAYNNIIVITEIISVFIFDMIIIFYLFKPVVSNIYRTQLELAEIKNNMLKNSLEETEHSFELWKKSIHDYKNNIIALTQMANEGNIDEIKDYLKQENLLLESRMFYIKTGNSVADAIINTKYNIAKHKNIKFIVNAEIDDNIPINGVDFAGLLGNLIDNAIDACKNENEPFITINLSKQKSFLIINITNKFTGILSKKTQKDKHFHGIGLSSVNRTIRKYNGEYSITQNEDMVIVKILLS